MSDYDVSLEERIDSLHDEAEELAARAKHAEPEEAERLIRRANGLVRRAAFLRRDIEEDD